MDQGTDAPPGPLIYHEDDDGIEARVERLEHQVYEANRLIQGIKGALRVEAGDDALDELAFQLEHLADSRKRGLNVVAATALTYLDDADVDRLLEQRNADASRP